MATKTASIDRATTTRHRRSDGLNRGAGKCKRLYIGAYDGSDYKTYFDIESLNHNHAWWDGVGQIISAILTVYVDDGFGVLGDTMPSGSPKVVFRRLTDGFSEGSSASWDTDDWTVAAGTTDHQKWVEPTRGSLEAVDINITAMVEDFAPTRVKRRDGGNGRKQANYGIGIFGTSYGADNWAIVSEEPEGALTAYKPVLTLNYTYGPTTPSTPSNLAPDGAVASVASFAGDFADVDSADTLKASQVQVSVSNGKSGTASATTNRVTRSSHGLTVGTEVWFTSLTGGAGLSVSQPYYVRSVPTSSTFTVSTSVGGTTVDITTDATALSYITPFYSKTQQEGNPAIIAARFDHVPDSLSLTVGTTYYWRARVQDSDGDWSAWTSLVAFNTTNTVPTAPTLSPPSLTTVSTLDSVEFSGGTFSDPDGDTLLAYQVQLSAYGSGDSHWLDDNFILWNTGKVYTALGATTWKTPYGGASLDAGTYYWRARHWDSKQGVSAWTYASIVLSADFIEEPETSVNAIQMRPKAPWRLVIKGMDVNRGPGSVVAIIEDAKNVGASILYNSPGEAHWTLGISHPQLSVIEPKQTHYSIQFRQGDGWREVYAGLVWDFDATDRDIVFYGIDYLALLDRVVDLRYDPANPDKDFSAGGSKYSNDAIGTIVHNQLQQARTQTNSPVGFITQAQSKATLDAMLTETVTVYSTYAPTLNFVTGLLDSHRAGRAYGTRLSVRQKTGGGYEFYIAENPGTTRSNLRLRYGELVQGYRVIPFGDNWATRVAAVGRDKDGIRVRYTEQTAPGIDEAVWGRFTVPSYIDGISDGNDLTRRARQQAVSASRLGQRVGLGLRSGILNPRDGYDLMDFFPVEIEHGSVSTTAFGHDGLWQAVGITWQALQRGDSNTTLTLVPKESGSAPSGDLLVDQPISGQREWQIGWQAPNPLLVSARNWLDQSTGTVYERQDGTIIVSGITGTI